MRRSSRSGSFAQSASCRRGSARRAATIASRRSVSRHDPDRLHRQAARRTTARACGSGRLLDLLLDDRVRGAQQLKVPGRDLAEHPDREPRTRKGWRRTMRSGSPSSSPSSRTSSLKSSRSGSTSLRCIRSGRPPTLLVALDDRRGPLKETDSITSGRACLARKLTLPMRRASSSKTRMNSLPMILRLRSDRRRRRASRGSALGVHHVEVQVEVIAKVRSHRCARRGAAPRCRRRCSSTSADRPVHQQRRHGRVHAAGERADHPALRPTVFLICATA